MMICSFQVFLVPVCFKCSVHYLSFCMGVSAIDFIVHLPSNRWFFWQNCCISRIALLGNITGELSATTIAEDGNEKINNFIKQKPLKKENFFAWLTLSNLNSNAVINYSFSTIITVFINGDCRDLDFVGSVHTEAHNCLHTVQLDVSFCDTDCSFYLLGGALP